MIDFEAFLFLNCEDMLKAASCKQYKSCKISFQKQKNFGIYIIFLLKNLISVMSPSSYGGITDFCDGAFPYG
jgi:hypothetical protein